MVVSVIVSNAVPDEDCRSPVTRMLPSGCSSSNLESGSHQRLVLDMIYSSRVDPKEI
jgi:hypothetical protein